DCFGASHVAPELMGFALLESMACGTPVACSRVGAMPEYVRDGETGFIYDDLDALTERLQRLASNPELVETSGRPGSDAVEQEYDLTIAGRRLYQLYCELAANAREKAA